MGNFGRRVDGVEEVNLCYIYKISQEHQVPKNKICAWYLRRRKLGFHQRTGLCLLTICWSQTRTKQLLAVCDWQQTLVCARTCSLASFGGQLPPSADCQATCKTLVPCLAFVLIISTAVETSSSAIQWKQRKENTPLSPFSAIKQKQSAKTDAYCIQQKPNNNTGCPSNSKSISIKHKENKGTQGKTPCWINQEKQRKPQHGR